MDVPKLNKRYNWLLLRLEEILEALIMRNHEKLVVLKTEEAPNMREIHLAVRDLVFVYDKRRVILDGQQSIDEPSPADNEAMKEVSRRLRELLELEDEDDEDDDMDGDYLGDPESETEIAATLEHDTATT